MAGPKDRLLSVSAITLGALAFAFCVLRAVIYPIIIARVFRA
jgi:hypothetical protein